MWAKTESGRAEMQRRALVADRAQRNLLLLVDGQKSDTVLLASVAGVSVHDLLHLESLGLIEQAGAPGVATRSAAATPNTPDTQPASIDFGPTLPSPEHVPVTYAEFSAALTRLIASQLGLRGLTMTLKVERAGSLAELHEVAQLVVEQLKGKRGDVIAEQARRSLFG